MQLHSLHVRTCESDVGPELGRRSGRDGAVASCPYTPSLARGALGADRRRLDHRAPASAATAAGQPRAKGRTAADAHGHAKEVGRRRRQRHPWDHPIASWQPRHCRRALPTEVRRLYMYQALHHAVRRFLGAPSLGASHPWACPILCRECAAPIF